MQHIAQRCWAILFAEVRTSTFDFDVRSRALRQCIFLCHLPLRQVFRANTVEFGQFFADRCQFHPADRIGTFFHFFHGSFRLLQGLQFELLGQLMERKAVKTSIAEEHSFRSNRTSNYNINDYLPPSFETMSRTLVFASRLREKTYTEPNERTSASELTEVKRKLERAEEEKGKIREEMEKMERQAEAREKLIIEKEEIMKEKEKKDETIKLLTAKVSQFQGKLAKERQRPPLSHSRSNVHFIYYPKLHQKYEVSVQTDSIDLAFSMPAQAKKAGKASDRQMSEIQEKISRLNLKKTNKEKSLKPTFQVGKLDKLQRGETIFSKIDDKQNMIRLSNTFDRVSNPQRLREETIQIAAMEIDQAQRMIRMYMQ